MTNTVYEEPDLFSSSHKPGVSVSDEQAWLWAQELIKEVSEEAQGNNVQSLIESFILWRQVAKLLGYMELDMHRRGDASPTTLRRHKTAVSGLIAIGGLLESTLAHLGASHRELALSFMREKEIQTVLKNLEDSYAHWHVPVSVADMDLIQKTFGLGDQQG